MRLRPAMAVVSFSGFSYLFFCERARSYESYSSSSREIVFPVANFHFFFYHDPRIKIYYKLQEYKNTYILYYHWELE